MRYTLFLMAGVLGGGIPALAQTASPALAAFAETVVVSASLDSEERDDIPASVTVLHREELEARQADTLSKAIATVPGVTAMQSGAPGQQTSLFLRGTDSEQTLLLWNGIPLNDPFFGGVNWQFVPLDGVARIEVARGPFSALYGSSAMGGIVQVFTGSRQGGTFSLEAGEDGYYRGGLAAGTDLGPVRLDLTGHLRRSDRADGELPNSFFDSEEMIARGLWTVRPGVSVGLLARANDSETGIPLVGGLPNPIGAIAWEERELAVPFVADLGSWEVEAQLSQTRFDSAFRDADDPFGFTASDTESEGLRGRVVTTWRRGEDLWIAVGSEAERLEVTSSSNFGTDLDGVHQRTWAVFGQGSWGHGPIRLDLGARRDDNDVYGAKTSLRSGIVWEAGAGVRLRASYGEAFRAPSLGELFFPFSGNPDLQPETGESFELGVERSAGNWRIGLTGFENRQRNLIDYDFVTNRNLNVDRARSRGVEGEAGFQRGVFDVRWNTTWLETEDRSTGLELLRRPEWSSALLLTARPAVLTLNVEGRYVGDRADIHPATGVRTENPEYLRVDLAARWRARAWLAPYARVQNVANGEYEEVLGYPAPGRTLIGGVAVEF